MKKQDRKQPLRITHGPVGLWSWRQGTREARAFPSLETCLQDANSCAKRSEPITVVCRRARLGAWEGVTYRFDAYDRLVPDLPEGRAIRRALLPLDQRR
ncbi:MAG: hypothetical protein AAF500_17955 [Myxococcota bacterium]